MLGILPGSRLQLQPWLGHQLARLQLGGPSEAQAETPGVRGMDAPSDRRGPSKVQSKGWESVHKC